MRYALILLLTFLFSTNTSAQQSDDTVKEIGKAVFSEVERRVIREVMGRVGLPKEETSEAEIEDDQTVDTGKGSKEKKHKQKGKSKKDKAKGKNKGMPPGLAKKDNLPKGLAKRDTLPPGLAQRELPQEVTSQLPPPAAGTERVIVDNDVILVEKGTQIVLDVIKDVITPK